MTFTLILLIVVLVLALVVIGFIAYGVNQVKRKVSDFSQMAFGTSDIRKGLEQVEREFETTPKSVSAMTSLYLPRITKDFPDFSYPEMKEKAQNCLRGYLLGLHNFDVSKLVDGNPELKSKLEQDINILKNADKREHFDNIRIHQTEISNYTKRNGKCIITFQTSVQYNYYVTGPDGQIIAGKKDVLFQSKYEEDLIYIQDASLLDTQYEAAMGLNCPNCGAPIVGLGKKFCEYCGTGIVEVNVMAWKFGDVREVTKK